VNNKFFSLITITGLLFLAGCSLLGSQPDTSAQIHALETQNALLAKQIEVIQQQNQQSSSRDDGTVPQPAESSGLQIEQSPKEPEQLPTEPVSSGTPIVYDGWQITVSSEIKVDNYNNWGIKIFVKNITENDRIFRFTNSSVTVTDDIGTIYNYVPKYRRVFETDCEAHLYTVKNLEIRSGKTAEISGHDVSCPENDGLLQYKDPIPLGAKQLIIELNEFGPFTGITVVIDL